MERTSRPTIAQTEHSAMRVVLLSITLLFALTLVACGGGGGGGGGDGGSGPGLGGGGPTISVLGFTNSPSLLKLRNGDMYWLDVSDVPLNRFSLGNEVYTPLFTELHNPESALSDGNNIFWVSGARLYKTPLNGAETELLDEGERDPASSVTAAIVMDSTHVYWANTVGTSGCSPACTFTIKQIPKSGGSATTIATTTQVIVDLAISGGFVFWEEEGLGPVNNDGSIGSKIKKVSVAGGTATVLVNGLLNGLIAPPSPGFDPASWHPRGGMATDGLDVYFADADFFQSYRVMKVPVAGGSVTVMDHVTAGNGSNFVRDMQLDDTHVYWVDADSLKSMPKAGGISVDLASGLPSPVSLAYIGGNLYWLETVCCAHKQKGAIKVISASGGAPLTVRADIESPVSISVDTSKLYWVEGGTIGETEGFGGIKSVAFGGGGEKSHVESALGGPFDVDDTYVYFANSFTIKRVPIAGGAVERIVISDFYVRDVATDGAFIYWVEDSMATVRKISPNGGPVTTLGSGSGPAGIIRLDATHVFWMDHEDTIRQVPKGGGGVVSVVGPVAGGITDFVVNGANVFFSEWDGARIRQTSVSGGATRTLVDFGPLHPDQTRRLETDGQAVYWIDQATIGKVPLTGGSMELFVQGATISDPFLAGGIAVDQTTVYWTESATGAIVMATPK